MVLRLGYWKIRGLAQPVRLLLEYTGEKYEDKLYELGNAPDYSRENWFSEKFNLGLDFPNLPYLIDGDLKLTQSSAILFYVADKHNMVGNSPQERASINMIAGQIQDARNTYIQLVYNPNFENLKGDYLIELPKTLKAFSDYLGNKQWLAGDKLTYPDFNFYDYLDIHLILAPNCLDNFANLKAYKDKFEKLEPIANYFKTDRYIRRPLNNKVAKFGTETN